MSQVNKNLLEKDGFDTFEIEASPRAGRKQHEENKKQKASKRKEKEPTKGRDRSGSKYSLISLSEVTEGALQIWRSLPEKIRQDPSLASFRQENERLHGKCYSISFIFLFPSIFSKRATIYFSPNNVTVFLNRTNFRGLKLWFCS